MGRGIELLAWVTYFGAGGLAVYWGRSKTTSPTLKQSAIDGVVAGGIAGALSCAAKFVAQIVLLSSLGPAFVDDAGRIAGAAVLAIECLLGLIGIISAVFLAGIGGMVCWVLTQRKLKSPAT